MTDRSTPNGAYAIASGPLPAALANAVSDAIHAAICRGMEVDEACSVVVGVVRDYWIQLYPMDDAAVVGLSTILRADRRQPGHQP